MLADGGGDDRRGFGAQRARPKTYVVETVRSAEFDFFRCHFIPLLARVPGLSLAILAILIRVRLAVVVDLAGQL